MAYTSEGMALSIRKIADMKWSEYNHHWMGLIVLAMGTAGLSGAHRPSSMGRILAAADDRHRHLYFSARRSRVLAARARRASGPPGRKPEIFQHRAAAILCIAFAIFELRVRRNPSQGGMLPLIFPLLCAVGAALLLTHSHGTSNVREETLAELSHTPMAVLGVMAGWSRWLEIRLPEEEIVASRPGSGRYASS